MKITIFCLFFLLSCAGPSKSKKTLEDPPLTLTQLYGDYWHKASEGLEKFDLAVLKVPDGLPVRILFPKRKILKVIQGTEADLVLVSFRDISDRFPSIAVAYNHFKKDKILDPINSPAGRMWNPRLDHNKAIGLTKLFFSECTDCGNGSRYSLTASYSKDSKKWDWSEKIVTEFESEEEEY